MSDQQGHIDPRGYRGEKKLLALGLDLLREHYNSNDSYVDAKHIKTCEFCIAYQQLVRWHNSSAQVRARVKRARAAVRKRVMRARIDINAIYRDDSNPRVTR